MTSYIETLVDVRLRPDENVPASPINVTKHTNPRFLIRTTSLDRIRQFPTYFCRQSSYEIYQWISSSKKNLSKHIAGLSQELHHLLLTVSVYTVVGLLLLQLASIIVSILTNPLPIGLVFLLSCAFIITVMATKIMRYKPKEVVHMSRSRIKRDKVE